MQVITIEGWYLRAVQAACAPSNSKDPREYLRYVCFDFEHRKAVGTDGPVMAVAPFAGEDLPASGNLLLALSGKVPKGWSVVNIYTEANLAKGPKSGQNLALVKPDHEWVYPDWKKIHLGSDKPLVCPGLRRIALDHRILTRVLGDAPARLEFQDETDPVRVLVENSELEITLAPCRW